MEQVKSTTVRMLLGMIEPTLREKAACWDGRISDPD